MPTGRIQLSEIELGELLIDQPASDDLLGTHESIAEALLNLVRNTKGGKRVALYGRWGSGKSTLIKLIQNKCQSISQSTDIKVVLYDAWFHRGDPHRRSFLETLFSCLVDYIWISEKSTEDKKQEIEELSGKLILESVTERTKFSVMGILFILTLLLLPFAVNMMTVITTWPKFVFLSISAIPFLLFLFGLISKNEKIKNDLLSLVIKTPQSAKVMETKRNVITAIEFRNTYRELLEEALSDSKRRLVIVIDNLDRLDNVEEGLRVLATINEMLVSTEECGKPKYEDRLWVIVPFDKESLTKLWSEDSSSNTGHQESEKGTACLDKLFHMYYQINEPVLYKSNEFFHSQARIAFPSLQTQDIDRMYSIMNAKWYKDRKRLTPRIIIRYLNRLNLLVKQYQESDYDLLTVWYYVLNEYDLQKGDVSDILKEDYLCDASQHMISENWQKVFAGLYYGVGPQKGFDILLRSELEECLIEGDCDQVIVLKDENEYFWRTALHYIEFEHSVWLAANPHMLFSVIHILNVIEDIGDLNAQMSIAILENDIKKINSLELLDELSCEGIISFITYTKNPQDTESIEKILGLLASSERLYTENSEEGDSLIPTINNLLRIIKYISSVYGNSIISKYYSVPLDASHYISLIGFIVNEDNESAFQYMYPSVSQDAVINQLCDMVKANDLAEHLVRCVSRMISMEYEWRWDDLAEALRMYLVPGQKSNEELNAILKLNLILASKVTSSIAKTNLGNLAENRKLDQVWDRSESDPKLRGLIALCVILEAPRSLNVVPQARQQQQSHNLNQFLNNPNTIKEIIPDISELIDTYSLHDDFIRQCLNQNKGNLLSECLEICNHDILCEYLDPADYVNAYSHMPSSVERVYLNTKLDVLLKYLDTQEYSASNTVLYSQLLNLQKINMDNTAALEIIQKILSQKLQSMSKQDIVVELEGASEFIKNLLEVICTGGTIQGQINVHDSLIVHAENLRQGRELPIIFDAMGEELYKLLEEDLREVFLSNLFDIAMKDLSKAKSLLLLYGNLLIEKLDEEKRTKLIKNAIQTMFVNGSEESKMDFMTVLLQRNPRILIQSPRPIRTELRKRIAQLKQEDSTSSNGELYLMLLEKSYIGKEKRTKFLIVHRNLENEHIVIEEVTSNASSGVFGVSKAIIDALGGDKSKIASIPLPSKYDTGIPKPPSKNFPPGTLYPFGSTGIPEKWLEDVRKTMSEMLGNPDFEVKNADITFSL